VGCVDVNRATDNCWTTLNAINSAVSDILFAVSRVLAGGVIRSSFPELLQKPFRSLRRLPFVSIIGAAITNITVATAAATPRHATLARKIVWDSIQGGP